MTAEAPLMRATAFTKDINVLVRCSAKYFELYLRLGPASRSQPIKRFPGCPASIKDIRKCASPLTEHQPLRCGAPRQALDEETL
jgi:hypothetical protein